MRVSGLIDDPMLPDAVRVRLSAVIIGNVAGNGKLTGLALIVPLEIKERVFVPV